MKFILFLLSHLLIIAVSGQRQKNKPKFHAFIFANTNDRNIGKACREDLTNIAKQTQVISDAIGYEFDQNTFDGAKFDINSLNDLMHGAKIKDSDIVFLYFTSHGARTNSDTSIFPNVLFPGLKEKYVNGESVHEAFKRKFHMKLLITMIDACDSFANIPQSQLVFFKESYQHQFPTMLRLNQVLFYKRLFKYINGDIIMTSSQKGATSYCTTEGSVFTNEFIRTMEHFSNIYLGLDQPTPTWKSFFNALQSSTKAKSLYISYQQGDTTARYPVWKNSTGQPDMPAYFIEGFSEIVIYTQQSSIGVTRIGQFPENLAREIEAVTYFIKDTAKRSEMVLNGIAKNDFRVEYTIEKDVLVYAEIKFKDGRKLDVAIVQM